MTNRQWVTLLYFLARHSHQSCLIPWPTGCEWHWFISLPGTLINYVSSYDQQFVSDTGLFLHQALSSIMFHPMTNSEWVRLLYFCARHSHESCLIPWPTVCEWHFFDRHSHQSCLIPWPTVCEWHWFISLPCALINHVSCHDQQRVSDTALFLCQALSSIMSQHIINRQWVTLLYFFAGHYHQSCLIPWPTVCEWHCFISLPGTLINHVSSMTNRKWVTLLYFFVRHSHQSCLIPWPTGSGWHCIISLPGTLINHVSSHDQQEVSDTALFLC